MMKHLRLPDEPKNAYEAFCIYANLPPQKRTKVEVQRQMGYKTPTMVFRWAKKFMWDERLDAAEKVANQTSEIVVSKQDYADLSAIYMADAISVVFKALKLRSDQWKDGELPDLRELQNYVMTLDRVDVLARRVFELDGRPMMGRSRGSRLEINSEDYEQYILTD